MDWTVAGPTRKTPAMLARRRYLKVYWPAGSRSKKKFVPLSRVSSYQARPRSHRCRETAFSGSHPAARGSRRCTYSASCLDEREIWTSTSSPGASTAPSERGFRTKPEADASRLKYFRETEKKSPRSSSGSFSVEKCHVADAKASPLLCFSTTTVDAVFGSSLPPGTTTWFFPPVYRSGSKTKVVVCPPTITVASSRI